MNKKSTLRSVANDYLTHPRRENGITLIALVVTIVVLIILATVSINAVLGQNGIIKKAKQTKEMYSNSIAKDNEEMDRLLNEMAQYDTDNSGSGGGTTKIVNIVTYFSLKKIDMIESLKSVE